MSARAVLRLAWQCFRGIPGHLADRLDHWTLDQHRPHPVFPGVCGGCARPWPCEEHVAARDRLDERKAP